MVIMGGLIVIFTRVLSYLLVAHVFSICGHSSSCQGVVVDGSTGGIAMVAFNQGLEMEVLNSIGNSTKMFCINHTKLIHHFHPFITVICFRRENDVGPSANFGLIFSLSYKQLCISMEICCDEEEIDE